MLDLSVNNVNVLQIGLEKAVLERGLTQADVRFFVAVPSQTAINDQVRVLSERERFRLNLRAFLFLVQLNALFDGATPLVAVTGSPQPTDMISKVLRHFRTTFVFDETPTGEKVKGGTFFFFLH